jgi:DNA polymerase I-like protein with 3'-5' exonuclease and polymerase domains
VAIAKAWGLDISIREAAKLKSLWLETWPEIDQYFRYIGSCEIGNGLYWVRQLRSGRLRLGCTFTSACNSYFQGLAADGAKAALYSVTKAQFDPDSPLFGSSCLVFVHDEILIEAPIDRVHECALELTRIMESEFNRFVPDCPTRAEAAAMLRWSKKAQPVHENGRLVPWAA